LKDFSEVRNTTNKLARRIKNLQTRLAKENIQININQLTNRVQIIPELVHKSDIIQGEVVMYLDDVVSYPGSKKHTTKDSIRVPRMFNHTHSNNMINR
jgi:hypothetical protein